MRDFFQLPTGAAGDVVRVVDGSSVGVRQGATTFVVAWCDVICARSEKKHTLICTTHGKLRSSAALADIVDAFASLGLVRIHRGVAVNASRVRRIVGHGRHHVTLLLDTGDEFPVGRQFQPGVRARFGFAKKPGVTVQP